MSEPVAADHGGRPAERQVGRPWLGLLGWIALTLAAAAIGSLFRPGSWYDALAKPDWTPPGAVFGPVWTALYLMMAVAAWLVWVRAGWTRGRPALSAYLAQLALNAAWSALFFGAHRIGLALLDISALWVLIAVTLVLFWRTRRSAGLLLVPYLLWVSYAVALNFEIWRLNG